MRILSVCLALLACSKPSTPNATESAPVPSIGTAPDGVIVRRIKGKCSRLPCPSELCEVTCPAQSEMLRVDIVEPLGGKVLVGIEGQEVWSGHTEDSMIGLGATLDVRPLRWPANVSVQVGERSGAVQVERVKPFVRMHGEKGPLLFESRAVRFMYE